MTSSESKQQQNNSVELTIMPALPKLSESRCRADIPGRAQRRPVLHWPMRGDIDGDRDNGKIKLRLDDSHTIITTDASAISAEATPQPRGACDPHRPVPRVLRSGESWDRARHQPDDNTDYQTLNQLTSQPTTAA